MPRYRNKPDLTRARLQERAKRRRRSNRGMVQKKGTPPHEYRPVERPAFVPTGARPVTVKDLFGGRLVRK